MSCQTSTCKRTIRFRKRLRNTLVVEHGSERCSDMMMGLQKSSGSTLSMPMTTPLRKRRLAKTRESKSGAQIKRRGCDSSRVLNLHQSHLVKAQKNHNQKSVAANPALRS